MPYPNYVWHLDGHHKLIRWHFVVHGAVDGFSRTIIYLHCADNNWAVTVFECFKNGVVQYGIPEKVPSDHGGENVDVWRFMLSSHNNAGSVLTGSSVHNERIERMWRDVHRSVCSVFSETFQGLEREGILDPCNDVDMFAYTTFFYQE